MTSRTPAIATPPPTITLAQAAAEGFRVPQRLTAPPRLVERYPGLYPLAVRLLIARRWLTWILGRHRWAQAGDPEATPQVIRRHSSLLMRELGAEEMVWQHNKVVNLRLAAARVDGVVIRPGETFSFNRTVGNCTRRKGYIEGMRLSNGSAIAGVGGGICQLANLIHWMVLHTDLTVVERSEHSFDPFPDKGRVLPWGVGCSIAYNYVDLVVRNDTDRTYRLQTWVDERHLRGVLWADSPLPVRYRVQARDERFLRHQGRVFRQNQIWRTATCKRTGNRVEETLVKENCALVKYSPDEAQIIDVLA
ncbi:MAG: VanW family protein [Nocardioides sp.]